MDLSQSFEGLWLAISDASLLLLQYLAWGAAFEAAFLFWSDLLFPEKSDD